MSRAAIAITLMLLSIGLGACTIFASKSEYGAYRKIRVAEDDRERLVAMGEYVAAHPDGQWAQTVEADRAQAEPATWEANRSSLEGLRFYMAAYPDGPHAAEAQPRLAALEAVQGRRDNEAAQARGVENDRREALAQRRRTWMTRASQFWTRTLITINNWGNPIAAVARANPEFSRAFGENPLPRCSREECIKFYQAAYAIPVPGSTRLERKLELFLRLRMKDSALYRAELLLPNKGFSRWYEQEHRTPVIDEDPEARQQAINWAIERIMPAIREVAPNAEQTMVVPEPIDPPTVRAPNQPDPGAAFDAPSEEEVEAAGQEAPDETENEPEPAPEAPAGEEEGGLDELLRQAAGDDTPAVLPEPETAPEAEPEPEVMVLPIALDGFKAGNVRIVIFAAAAEDYGSAYDGLFIEFEAPAEEPPTRRSRRRR